MKNRIATSNLPRIFVPKNVQLFDFGIPERSLAIITDSCATYIEKGKVYHTPLLSYKNQNGGRSFILRKIEEPNPDTLLFSTGSDDIDKTKLADLEHYMLYANGNVTSRILKERFVNDEKVKWTEWETLSLGNDHTGLFEIVRARPKISQ